MKKSIFILSISALMLVALSTKSFAQADYKTGIGVRGGGYENGLTIKHFTNSSTAIEGIFGFRPGVFVVTGLYEKHATAFGEPSVNWYYGAGAHIGGVDDGRYYKYYGRERFYDNRLLLGADGILGLEWKIPEIPFALSVDLHPRIELANGPYFDLEPAASLRFTF
ncbi:hypothetical protein N9R54_03180 [Pelobium sp.]|nr:hypothetical protein [Pelobium sp.]MDA9555220.1 hypothetical protein [Pelobium sp.]